MVRSNFRSGHVPRARKMSEDCPEVPHRGNVVLCSAGSRTWLLHRITGEAVSLNCVSCQLHFDMEGYGYIQKRDATGNETHATVSDTLTSSLHEAVVDESRVLFVQSDSGDASYLDDLLSKAEPKQVVLPIALAGISNLSMLVYYHCAPKQGCKSWGSLFPSAPVERGGLQALEHRASLVQATTGRAGLESDVGTLFLLCLASSAQSTSAIGAGTDSCRATAVLESLIATMLSASGAWTLAHTPQSITCTGTLVNLQEVMSRCTGPWLAFWTQVAEMASMRSGQVTLLQLLLALMRIDSHKGHTQSAKTKSRLVLLECIASLELLLELLSRQLLHDDLTGLPVVHFRTRARAIEAPVMLTLAHASRRVRSKRSFFAGMAALNAAHRQSKDSTLRVSAGASTMTRGSSRAAENAMASYWLASRRLMSDSTASLHLSIDGVTVGR
eukprot:6492311-Amphidinium_carterae.1